MKTNYFVSSTIAMGKNGLPQAWRSWSPEMRKAWLDGRLAELEKRTGVKIRSMIKREVQNAVVRLRVQHRLAHPTFEDQVRGWDAEAKLSDAITAAFQRLEAQKKAKPAVRRPGTAPTLDGLVAEAKKLIEEIKRQPRRTGGVK